MSDKAVVDEVVIKVGVDTTELNNFKNAAKGFGDGFANSMNKGLRNFNTKKVVKQIESDANALAERMAKDLTESFIIDDKYAVGEVRKLSHSLVNAMKVEFKQSGLGMGKAVEQITNELADSLKRNGRVVENESGEYKARLKEFYDWYLQQGQFKLPTGYNNPALEGNGVFGGKFSKTKGMDLTGQNALRESFRDLFDDEQLKNQENAIDRVIELIKEYKTTVETIKPISATLDADDKIYATLIQHISDTNAEFQKEADYIENLKKQGYEAGNAFNFNGSLNQANNSLRQLENKLSEMGTRFASKRWKFGTTNFENAIVEMSRIEGMIDAIKDKIAQIDKSDDYKKRVDEIVDGIVAREKELEIVREEDGELKNISERTNENTNSAKYYNYELDHGLQALKRVINGEEKRAQIIGEISHRGLGANQKYTEEYTKLSNELEKTYASYDKLLDKKEKFDETGRSTKTATYKNLNYDIDNTAKKIEHLEKALIKMQEAGKDVENIDFDRMGESAKNTSNILTQVSTALRGMGFRSTATKVQALGRNFANVSKNATEMTGAVGGIAGAVPQIAIVGGAILIVGKAIQKVIQLFAKFASMVVSTCARIVKTVANVAKAFTGLGGSTNALSRLVRKFFMTLRNRGISKIVMGLFSQAKESLQSLAAFSNRIGSDFNKNISSLISNFKLLGNSMAAAFEPILNVVTPYLDFLMQKLVAAINVINQFFNALTGSSTWTKATYQAVNYGASVGDAAKKQKELNKQLQKFDELNNISQNDNNNGSGGSGSTAVNPNAFTTEEIDSDVASFAQRFKEAWEKADFTSIGFDFGAAIKDALDGINWESIKESAYKVGKSIATFINGSLSVAGLPEALGNAVAQGINTFVNGISGFVKNVSWVNIGYFVGTSISNAISNIDWDLIKETAGDIGDGLATSINALLNTDVLSKIGMAVGNILKTGVEGWWKFVTTFDFSKLGTEVSNAINNFFASMADVDSTGKSGWTKLGESISQSMKGIVTSVSEAIKGVDWRLVGQSVRDMIKAIDWKGIAWQVGDCADAIKGAIADALKGANISITDVILSITKFVLKFGDKIEGASNGMLAIDTIANFVSKKIGFSDTSIGMVANFTSKIFSKSWSDKLDVIAQIISIVKDGNLNNQIGGLVAKIASFDFSVVGKTIKGIILEILSIVIPEPLKTIGGFIANFTGTPKIDVKDKDKKVTGFQAVVNKFKDKIAKGTKKINNATVNITKYDTSKLGNVVVEGTVKVDPIVGREGAKVYYKNSKGQKYYYGEDGQLHFVKNGGVFNGNYKSIAQYAGGGIPDHGTHFIAGEAGAEVVGNVGRRTEVLNQSQLAATMYSAIVNGMTQVMKEYGGNQPIYLDGKVLFDNTRQRANDYFNRTGNSAFAY